MASSSPDYVIYHPEKLRLSDIFTIIAFGRSPLGSGLIETTSSNTNGAHGTVGLSLISLITLVIQKILLLISTPMALLGIAVEFTLNFLSLNGGVLGLLLHLVTGKLVIPSRESADYRRMIGHVEGRTDLYKVSAVLNHLPLMESVLNPLDLSIMAAKIVYENKAFVQTTVTNSWKMYFVGHYNFWNEALGAEDTQAFICCDRQQKAQLILVAFRGTEPFNARDWVTDVDLSWMKMGEMGRVHVGFMKALGLQDEKKGMPKDYKGSKKLAYYSIRTTLKTLLQQSPSARIIVTGHSLGGALAILFPAILVLHQEDDIMSRLMGVYTFGQPRVGDTDFGNYMKPHLNVTFKRYYRVVYRYDFVPRVPFEDRIFDFAHFGGCLYYHSWTKGEALKVEPDMNYFNILYIPSKYLNAVLDLIRGIFAGLKHGKDFKESLVSILYRTAGLIFPGFASHSPRDYVNGARLAKVLVMEEDEDGEVSGF